jgi:hypothetical protein
MNLENKSLAELREIIRRQASLLEILQGSFPTLGMKTCGHCQHFSKYEGSAVLGRCIVATPVWDGDEMLSHAECETTDTRAHFCDCFKLTTETP